MPVIRKKNSRKKPSRGQRLEQVPALSNARRIGGINQVKTNSVKCNLLFRDLLSARKYHDEADK